MKPQRDGHIRLAIRLLSITLTLFSSTFSQSWTRPPKAEASVTAPASDQPPSGRFWIAGRYDDGQSLNHMRLLQSLETGE
jgi:hypothetical protein